MLAPKLMPLLTVPRLRSLLHAYCRLGYELVLRCSSAADPDPFCQRLAERRHELQAATQHQLQHGHHIDAGDAPRVFAQLSQAMFRQLLHEDLMDRLPLDQALEMPLPT